jgi:hypothetical protein
MEQARLPSEATPTARAKDVGRAGILARLTLDFSCLQVVELRASMLAIVPELVVRHPLPGYDAGGPSAYTVDASVSSSQAVSASTDGRTTGLALGGLRSPSCRTALRPRSVVPEGVRVRSGRSACCANRQAKMGARMSALR